jgi:hypothetical protein
MLCESLFHLLIEEGVITKAKAIEAIEGVAEPTREIEEGGPPTSGTKLRPNSSKRSQRALH